VLAPHLRADAFVPTPPESEIADPVCAWVSAGADVGGALELRELQKGDPPGLRSEGRTSRRLEG
jgi:hypothetical protein